jgi:putative ABC transport system ATP-binding protein
MLATRVTHEDRRDESIANAQAARRVGDEAVKTTRAVIELAAVSKVFRTSEVETKALDCIHLRIDAGEFVCITGPSGCGKSTLLSVLGLLAKPTDGEHYLLGMPTAGLTEEARTKARRNRIGFVFQNFNLIESLTIEQNVGLGLLFSGLPDSKRHAKVRDTLDRFGIAHRARHRPPQLSGGQQQRAAIARAVIAEPLLLLADEPTGNLDSRNGEAVMMMLRDLSESGTTIAIVTHSPEQVRKANRRIAMVDGHLFEEAAR